MQVKLAPMQTWKKQSRVIRFEEDRFIHFEISRGISPLIFKPSQVSNLEVKVRIEGFTVAWTRKWSDFWLDARSLQNQNKHEIILLFKIVEIAEIVIYFRIFLILCGKYDGSAMINQSTT